MGVILPNIMLIPKNEPFVPGMCTNVLNLCEALCQNREFTHKQYQTINKIKKGNFSLRKRVVCHTIYN